MSVTIIPTGQQSIELCAEDSQYVMWLNNRLTLYGQLPYTIPQRMITSCIISCARTFYRMYYLARESAWMIIRKDDLKAYSNEHFPHLKRQGFIGNAVKLHPSIRVVKSVIMCNRNDSVTAMEILDNLQYGVNPQYYGQALIGINNNLYITEAVCKMVEMTAMESIIGEAMPYSFNALTSMFVLERDTDQDVAIEVEKDVPVQRLYNDDLFDKYVFACCRRELRRLIGSHTIQLPGETTLNVDEVCGNYQEEIQAVEDTLKAGSGVGDIIMFGRN